MIVISNKLTDAITHVYHEDDKVYLTARQLLANRERHQDVTTASHYLERGVSGEKLNGDFHQPVPVRITRSQAKKALFRKNSALGSAIDTVINESGNEEAKIDWENSTHFYRDNPFIQSLAEKIPLTDAEVDQLFIDGALIE